MSELTDCIEQGVRDAWAENMKRDRMRDAADAAEDREIKELAENMDAHKAMTDKDNGERIAKLPWYEGQTQADRDAFFLRGKVVAKTTEIADLKAKIASLESQIDDLASVRELKSPWEGFRRRLR